eukprot:scaffold223243_cov32-Prasinocladus_malaysianus.AAC.1
MSRTEAYWQDMVCSFPGHKSFQFCNSLVCNPAARHNPCDWATLPRLWVVWDIEYAFAQLITT